MKTEKCELCNGTGVNDILVVGYRCRGLFEQAKELDPTCATCHGKGTVEITKETPNEI